MSKNPLPLDVLERVSRGIEYLDRYHPGWVDQIDLDTFDIAHPCLCVIGQACGIYNLCSDEIHDRTGVTPYDLGFDGPEDYADLQQAWTEIIQHRRRAGV